MNDGFGLLLAFCVIAGLIWGILKGSSKQPVQPIKKTRHRKCKVEIDLLDLEDSEFDGAILFGDYWFPPDDIENN